MKIKYIPGDLVIYKGEICEVTSSDNGDKRHSQYSIIRVGEGITSFTFAHEKDIEPLPITTQILKNNGWEDDGCGYDYQLNERLYLINAEYRDKTHKEIESVEVHSNISPESYDVGQDDFYLRTVSAVHQLQHLLWALGLNYYLKV